jgi:hypothetical protein
MISGRPFRDRPMVQPLSTTENAMQPSVRPSRVASVIVASAAAFVALLLVGAIGLWAHYGTAVFFEMIKSGIAACM